MSDITLVVSAPGPTVELTADAPGAVTVTVNEGGGVSTHAELSDLATSGHPASVIAFTPTGSIAATTVQAAVAEVATDAAAAYQPLDADLTAVAALTTPATTISGAVQQSLVDAAGDLIYATAADTVARLPLGTAAQVLRVNSGATAPEWAAASAGAVSVIARTVLGSDTASVDFTSIPATYETLMVTYLARGTGSNTWSRVWLRFNADSGSNYQYGSGGRVGASFTVVDAASGQAQMVVGLLPDASATAAYPAAGTLTVAGYGRTVFNKVVSCVDVSPASTANNAAVMTGGLWASTAAVTQVTLLASSGNFVAGSVFTLYGIAGA